ncbi:MAG: AmmeMemoRadiSam system protein B [Planctomycetota bacterium]|jgi:AmmeMemoRadiSam system protein B
MLWDPSYKPRLRPVEAFRIQDADRATIGLRDRSGLSDVVLSMSAPALHLLSLMDGEHTCDEIRSEFRAAFGQSVAMETLRTMLDHLERARFLEGPAFESYFQALLSEYRAKGVRKMSLAAPPGISDASGDLFRQMLPSDGQAPPVPVDRVRGLVAPHLDYPRGEPCYASAYGAIRRRPRPDRVVILGTNHFGRSTGVVATANDFETPLGRTPCDREFLTRLETRCGDLRRYELDHAREHSIELQVVWLQFLFGAETLKIAPFLCPDPCGPTGTIPSDGRGVDLREFATVLGDLIAEDPTDTLLIAGADLSHIGASFGDERTIDDAFLDEVRIRDRRALDHLELGDPDGFVRRIAEHDNSTRICSAGCIFALATALPGARATVLRYHQVVDHETQTCVTCAAAVYA